MKKVGKGAGAASKKTAKGDGGLKSGSDSTTRDSGRALFSIQLSPRHTKIGRTAGRIEQERERKE